MYRKCRGIAKIKKQSAGVIIIIFTILLSVVFSGCSSSAQSGALKVGVRDDILGLGYLNPVTQKYYGLEIDIANQLAEDLGYQEVQFIPVQPDNRKEKLLNGEVDCLIAAYSISDVRKKNFDFSKPYYKDKIEVMVQRTSLFQSIEDLKGKKIGVLSGVNTAVEFAIKMNELGLIDDFDSESFVADSYKGGISFESIDSYKDLSIALEEGKVDAICMDGSIAKAYMNEDRVFLKTAFAEQDYGVATPKGSKLSKAVAKSMDKMLKDGTIDRLIDKWN